MKRNKKIIISLVVLSLCGLVLLVYFFFTNEKELTPGLKKCQEILAQPDHPNEGISVDKAKCMGQL